MKQYVSRCKLNNLTLQILVVISINRSFKKHARN
jgi:hypothetical protein